MKKTAKRKVHGNAVLSIARVRMVKRWIKQGYTQQSIADYVGVTRGAIAHIVNGRTWVDVRPKKSRR